LSDNLVYCYSVFFYYELNVVNSLRGEGLVVEPIISLAYMIDDFHWIMNDKFPRTVTYWLNRLRNIYKYFGITSIIHALDYKKYVNKLMFLIFYSIILFTVVYFDSATAGEIKRDIYNILVKQSYIYNTSVSLVFVRWSGICVCTCVRARTHIYIYIHVYIYIRLKIKPNSVRIRF
jgi:hypothetical protein